MMRKAQFAARFYCVLNYFQPADLKTSGVEILIIEVDNDPLVEKALRDMMKATYRSATIKTLPGAVHFPHPAPLEHRGSVEQSFIHHPSMLTHA